MENFDLELTSEESGKIDIQSHSKPYQGRVREITKSGNLYIDPGEIWEYWNVLKSENLFERLFLDITLQDMITNEKVTNHYNQIKNYLARWREREGSGINFSSSHNGYSVSELERYLEDAFISLKNVQGRVDYYASWKRKADSDAYEKLAPYILTAIEDKILSFTEKRLIFTEGQKLGLTNDQIAEEINKYKRIRGDVKDETESENKLPAIIMTKEDAYNLFSVSKDASEQEIEESYHILRDSYITGLNSSIENIRTRSKIKLEEIDYAFSLIQKARKEMVHENEPLLPVKLGQAKKQVAKTEIKQKDADPREKKMQIINTFIIKFSKYFDGKTIFLVKEMLESRIEAVDDALLFIRMKNPIVTILLGVFLGFYGADRFFLKDFGLGALKLGLVIIIGLIARNESLLGLYIFPWIFYIADLITAKSRTAKYNLLALENYLNLNSGTFR